MPIISMPEDETWRKLLQQKHECYLRRWTASDAYKAPEEWSRNSYSVRVIRELIANGSVDTHELSRLMFEEIGIAFDVDLFNDACKIIDAYTHDREFLERRLNTH